MFPGEVTYWFLPGYVLVWVLFAVALGLTVRRLYFLYRLLRLGRPERRFDHIGQRLKIALARVFLQVCSLRRVSLRDRAGLGHFFIFWGFMLFLASYLIYIFIGEGLRLGPYLEDTAFDRAFSFALDIAGVLVFLAIVWAFLRRYLFTPPRLERKAEAGIILALIAVLMASFLTMEGLRVNLTETAKAPVRDFIAGLFSGAGQGAQKGLYLGLWWLHYVIILAFLVYIPYSKHLHIMTIPFNAFFCSLEPRGRLKLMDLEAEETFGAGSVEGFTWKQLLDGYACTHCGRCQVNCPAWNSGKPLNPKEVVLHIKDHLLEVGGRLLAGKEGERPDLISQVITEEVVWECTTCRACQEECPALIEHIPKIVDMRRHLVLERAAIPETAEGALRSLESRGHPWRGTTATRTGWLEGLEVPEIAQKQDAEYLFWVGCTGALEDRNIRVVKALAAVLLRAGVSFAVLGAEEVCCGDPARRLGNEYLFQLQAGQNIETLKRYGVRKIFTACPHCFNTLKNEYPQLGGEFEVFHHSQLLEEALKAGRLDLKQFNVRATYHDSCYLGRYNDIYAPPRELLRRVPGLKLVEMSRRGRQGFCCGGGGGRMWQEETIGRRINHIRTEEALETGCEVIATACPFCIQMFEDGLRSKEAEERVKALDLAEIVAQALAD